MQINDFLFLDFQDFLIHTFNLAQKIKTQSKDSFDYLIAINRGGAVLARFLSDLLQVKMGAFAMASYEGVNLRKELKITQKLNLDLKDKKILLVDEICDSGSTFIKAIDYLKTFKPSKVTTASLVVKPKAKYAPDFWIKEIDKWVVFPYEIRETIEATQGESIEVKSAIFAYFARLGISKTMLESIQHD